MNLRILSDLHFEFHTDAGRGFVSSLDVHPNEVLVLAGDLATPWILAQSVALLCGRFRHVLFVAGNHGYYGARPSEVHDILRAATARHNNLHWLDCSAVTIDGQRFLGASLWFGEEAGRHPARHLLSDFTAIEDFEPWVYEQNTRAVAYLNRNVQATDVVVTHHLPSQACVAPKWATSPLNPFFVHDMEPLIRARQPKLWVHGHTHEVVDVRLGATRIVANPFGYRGREEQAAFQPNLRIEM